ncbi:hypothetical protein HNR06_002623 [Nocardiopsis arvandica]|uniref:Uncharacterized protein n=1 Tax=Nocardiopsis sinuspersici TaxID=501010 RepID=A0A7Y9XC31_9ACTN|nr:hypothetical protein [Nocardiopsis sinuspersici]NYH53034.1 hypothetical protein [Nocardiopsis sinuspersici]
MLLPALVARSYGDLTSDQVRWLHDKLQLDEGTPRTEGYGAKMSIAHRTFTDTASNHLVLELGRSGDDGWLFSVYFEGERPSTETVEHHRRLFRDLIDQLGLTLLEIEPAATADEVFVVSPQPGNIEGGVGVSWDLPYKELDQAWFHLGLRKDAPREVKEVKLRELMSFPIWSVAPEPLRSQAEEFLRET